MNIRLMRLQPEGVREVKKMRYDNIPARVDKIKIVTTSNSDEDLGNRPCSAGGNVK